MAKSLYFWLFLFAAFVFLTHYLIAGQAIYGDGIDYWAYLPSLYYDHDLDFTDQYTHIYNPQNNNVTVPLRAPQIQKTSRTLIGRVDNPHPPGTALVWLPAFAAADALSLIFTLPRQGYAHLYQLVTGIFYLLVLVLALKLNGLLANRFVNDHRHSQLAVIAIFFATPLLYYGSYDILNSHLASFLLNSLFWLVLFSALVKHQRFPLVLGVIIALATLVRLQDALLLVPAFLFLSHRSVLPLRAIVELCLTWFLCLSPLFIVWNSLYGLPVPLAYLSSGHIYRGVWGPLFHRTNGLFSRTPILLFSLFGLKSFFVRFRQPALLIISYICLQFLLITYQGGWRDAAYGGRMFISILPLFTILLALTLQAISQKWQFKFAILTVIAFSLLNIISITSFVLFEKQVNSGLKTGLEEPTLERLHQIFSNF